MQNIQTTISELQSGEDARAEMALASLRIDDVEAHVALLRLSRSSVVDHRWWAVRGLAASAVTKPDDLVPFLADNEPEIRAAAALALCSHPAPSSVPALLRALLDEDASTVDLAGKALARVGSPAVESLLKLLPQAPPRARIAAVRALAEIGDHRAIPALLSAAGDDTALSQHWARQGLERLGLDMVFLQP